MKVGTAVMSPGPGSKEGPAKAQWTPTTRKISPPSLGPGSLPGPARKHSQTPRRGFTQWQSFTPPHCGLFPPLR